MMMRAAWAVVVLGLVLPACGEPSTEELLSGGEVASDSAYRVLDYPLTSDNYTKWLAAQSALDSADVNPRMRLDPRRLRGHEVDGVVEALEQDTLARAAIESSGLSVRDYVLTTIALAQSWDAVNAPGGGLTGVPAGNVAWLRQRSSDAERSAEGVVDAGVIRARPRARILDDSDSDSDSDHRDSDSDKKRRKKGGRRG
jgi:hypothetical protein